MDPSIGPTQPGPEPLLVSCECGESFVVPSIWSGARRPCPACGRKVRVGSGSFGTELALAAWLGTCPSARLPTGMLLSLTTLGFGVRALVPVLAPDLILLAYAAGMLGWGVLLWLLFQGWKSIQDGHARVSPLGAVARLFVPIYGAYWCFQAFWGLARDHNQLVERHCLNAARLPEGLFVAFAFLGSLPTVYLMLHPSWDLLVPFFGAPLFIHPDTGGFWPTVFLLAPMAGFFVQMLLVSELCLAMNALRATVLRHEREEEA